MFSTGTSINIPLVCPSAIILTKITATAPAAPEIKPGLPPKIAVINPMIKAPDKAIKGSICATKANATTSGIIAKETVIPAKTSSFAFGIIFRINSVICLNFRAAKVRLIKRFANAYMYICVSIVIIPLLNEEIHTYILCYCIFMSNQKG